MEKDIKQLIEEEARRLSDSYFYFDVGDVTEHSKKIMSTSFTDGANFGYNLCLQKWQASERWRKVEEEVPACEDDLVIVKVRNKNKEDGIFLYDICYIDEETNTWGKRHHTWEDIIEWKPVH